MGNVLDYIKKYADLTLDELLFNDIDNMVFASLSYINFNKIVSPNRDNKITIQEAAKKYFSKHSKKELKNNIMGVVTAIKILYAIQDTKRYKDLCIYNYIYSFGDEKQFSALFVDIKPDLIYISYEGTDELVAGWKEDAQMAYKFPIASQTEAIKYINHRVYMSDKNIYVGGHSKGGNLALVASMYAHPYIKNRIKKIYCNDSPGLKLKQFKSLHYKAIENKIKLIIPENSVIGLTLRHTNDYFVCASNQPGFFGHNMITWEIDGAKLKEAKLSKFSKRIDSSIDKWLNETDDKTREQFVLDLFDVLDRTGINNLLEIKDSLIPNVINILKESKNLEPTTRKNIKGMINFFVDYVKTDAYALIKGALKKK